MKAIKECANCAAMELIQVAYANGIILSCKRCFHILYAFIEPNHKFALKKKKNKPHKALKDAEKG